MSVFCHKCGVQAPTESMFCFKCGTKLHLADPPDIQGYRQPEPAPTALVPQAAVASARENNQSGSGTSYTHGYGQSRFADASNALPKYQSETVVVLSPDHESPSPGFWALWAAGTFLTLIIGFIGLAIADSESSTVALWLLVIGCILCLANIGFALLTKGYTDGDWVEFGRVVAVISGFASLALTAVLVVMAVLIILVVVAVTVLFGLVFLIRYI